MENPPKKLLEQVKDRIWLKHYSYRTEETYIQWIRRYILFHNKRHPKDIGVPEIESFLSHLAVEGNVTAATQNQKHRRSRPLPLPPLPPRKRHPKSPQASRLAAIPKRTSCLTFHHAFATQGLLGVAMVGVRLKLSGLLIQQDLG